MVKGTLGGKHNPELLFKWTMNLRRFIIFKTIKLKQSAARLNVY